MEVPSDLGVDAPPPAQAPPHPATAAGVASNLNDVLRTDSIFRQAPSLALSLAKLGGQAVAAGAVAWMRNVKQ